MRYYSTVKTITLDDSIIQKAKGFAESVVKTINYSDSNQFNLQKIADDHFISKIGEEAVKKVFESLGKSVQGPDYTIYKIDKKTWDADLIIDKSLDIAVKTQKKSAAERYGLSWTFQASPARRDIILDNKDAWVVFVECNDKDDSFDCVVYPPYQIKELNFGEPKLDYLKGKKRVVYATNLPVV